MVNYPQSYLDMPGTYQIRVHGHLSRHWLDAASGEIFDIHHPTAEANETVFSCHVLDQSALLGIVNGLVDTGHPVIAVVRVEPETASDPGEEAGLFSV
jgi:hypothetical protein